MDRRPEFGKLRTTCSGALSSARQAATALFAITAAADTFRIWNSEGILLSSIPTSGGVERPAQGDKFVMLDGLIMNPDTRFESITGVVIIATLTHEISIHKKVK